MESGSLGEGYNPWGNALFGTLKTVQPRSASEQAAYSKWLDQRQDREDARADRVHGAEGVIPAPLWIVLLLSALVIFGYMLFFADSGERVIVQATMMGSVAIVITSTLLLLWFLDNPYHRGVSGLDHGDAADPRAPQARDRNRRRTVRDSLQPARGSNHSLSPRPRPGSRRSIGPARSTRLGPPSPR